MPFWYLIRKFKAGTMTKTDKEEQAIVWEEQMTKGHKIMLQMTSKGNRTDDEIQSQTFFFLNNRGHC